MQYRSQSSLWWWSWGFHLDRHWTASLTSQSEMQGCLRNKKTTNNDRRGRDKTLKKLIGTIIRFLYCTPTNFGLADKMIIVLNKQTDRQQNKLYRPSDCRLSAKLVPTFADRGCRVVGARDPHGRILGFLVRSRYYFPSSSSIVLTRLSGPHSRPTTSQKIW
jgi:hypothetical protein